MKPCVALIVSFLLSTSLASAQVPVKSEQRITATVTSNAPIYVSAPPNLTLGPLRVAAVGTVLKVLGEKDEWLNVEFSDPQYGPRVGWVQKKLVRIDDPALAPMDLSVPKETKPSPAAFVRSPAPAPENQTATAQKQNKSRSMGFFVGGGFEGNGVAVEGSDVTESGSGFGLTLGYGFTPRVAIYGQISGARVESADVFGDYGLGHFDVGARVHFRAPTKTVVPFIQFGLSSRAIGYEFLGDDWVVTGFGGTFGVGLNAHFTPAVAFTTSGVWSVGSLSNLKINGDSVPFDSFGFTTARVHIGIIWFPQAK